MSKSTDFFEKMREKIKSNTTLRKKEKIKILKELNDTELDFYIRTAPADVKRIIYGYTTDSNFTFLNGILFTPDNFCKFFKVSKKFYKDNEKIFEKGENKHIRKYIDVVWDKLERTPHKHAKPLYMILDIIYYILDNYKLKNVYRRLLYNTENQVVRLGPLGHDIESLELSAIMNMLGSTKHLDDQLKAGKISKEFYDNMIEKYKIFEKKKKKVEKLM